MNNWKRETSSSLSHEQHMKFPKKMKKYQVVSFHEASNILTIICPLNHARYRLQCKIQKSWRLLPRRCIQIFPTNLLWFTSGTIDPADRLLRRQNGDENYFRSCSIYERVSDLASWYVDRVTFFLVGVGFPLKMEATKTHFPRGRESAHVLSRMAHRKRRYGFPLFLLRGHMSR